MRVESARGVPYVQEFSLRTGWGPGEAITPPSCAYVEDRAQERRREQQRIDALWRAWSRNRGDFKVLRDLYAALGERLRDVQPM